MYVAKKKNFTELKKVFTMAIRILKKASKYDVIKVKSVVLLIFFEDRRHREDNWQLRKRLP